MAPARPHGGRNAGVRSTTLEPNSARCRAMLGGGEPALAGVVASLNLDALGCGLGQLGPPTDAGLVPESQANLPGWPSTTQPARLRSGRLRAHSTVLRWRLVSA